MDNKKTKAKSSKGNIFLKYCLIYRRFTWKIKLNDSIQHMITVMSTQCMNKIYCGLSDGSLAVFETTDSEPNDVFYVNFSKAPLTFIELVQSDTSFESFLWMATANIIIEINERSISHNIFKIFFTYHNVFFLILHSF